MAQFGSPTLRGHASGGPLSFPKPTDLRDGDLIIAPIRAQEANSSAAWVIPSGFSALAPEPTTAAQITSRRRGNIFAHKVTNAADEPASYSFGILNSSTRVVGGLFILRTEVSGNLTIQGYGAYGGDSLSNGIATLAARTNAGAGISLVMMGSENVAGVSMDPTQLPAGYTELFRVQNTLDNSTSGSRTAMWFGYKVLSTNAFTQISGGWSGGAGYAMYEATITGGGVVAPSYPGVGIKTKEGDALLTITDGSGLEVVPQLETWWPGFASVTDYINTQGATSSHRGGSLTNPEMTEKAYDKSVVAAYPVLEFSCGWTSDLVPFGLGNQYLDSMAGVTGNVDPTTMTWAQLAETYVNKNNPIAPGVFQPFYKLEDFLAKYTRTHIVLVDPKFGWATTAKINKMLDICDANGGPSKIVIKFDAPVDWAILVDAAKARGYKTMNYWGTEQDKLTTQYLIDKWDLIGVRYDAPQAMYDAALAIGKKVWAAVIPDQAGYNLAASRGANLMMCSNVPGIIPVR